VEVQWDNAARNDGLYAPDELNNAGGRVERRCRDFLGNGDKLGSCGGVRGRGGGGGGALPARRAGCADGVSVGVVSALVASLGRCREGCGTCGGLLGACVGACKVASEETLGGCVEGRTLSGERMGWRDARRRWDEVGDEDAYL